jgi:hypothetical protein
VYPVVAQLQKYYFPLDAKTNVVFPAVEEFISRRTATNQPLRGRNRRWGRVDV